MHSHLFCIKHYYITITATALVLYSKQPYTLCWHAAQRVIHANVDVVRGKHVSQVTSCWACSPEASVGLVCCVKWHSTTVHMFWVGLTVQRLDHSKPSLLSVRCWETSVFLRRV